MGIHDEVSISALLGKTLVAVKGAENGSETIMFLTADGERYRMYHSQDCCESVAVEDICGEVADLLGEPLVEAEEVTSENVDPPGITSDAYRDKSFTWTFYKLRTAKGAVTLRWLGSSNGYYSESVTFERD